MGLGIQEAEDFGQKDQLGKNSDKGGNVDLPSGQIVVCLSVPYPVNDERIPAGIEIST